VAAITRFVHDCDAKAMGVLREAGWELEERRDPGHLFKAAFATDFKACSVKQIDGKNVRTLLGLETKLLRHMRWWMRAEFETRRVREKAWFGAFEHYTRRESKWRLKDSDVARDSLHEFLTRVWQLIRDAQRTEHTNFVESLWAMRARLVAKNFRFSQGFPGRSGVAILERNEGRDWVISAVHELGIAELSEESEARIRADALRHAELRLQRPCADGRLKHRKQRAALRDRRQGETDRGRKGGHIPPFARIARPSQGAGRIFGHPADRASSESP
jgi:hypothetical protein